MGNLKEYLNQILFLEKSIYAMMNLIEKYDYKVKNWPMPQEISMPDIVLERSLEEKHSDTATAVYFAVVGSLIVGTIFNIVGGAIIISEAFGVDWNFKTCGITYLVIAIIIFFGCRWMCRDDSEEHRDEVNKKLWAEYEQNVKQYNKDKKREIEKKNIFLSERNEVYRNMQQCKKTLDSLYSLNIIYPKYRNFVAIASFCEYLNAGRCSSLEGHEGAYNIYENEIRQNIIIAQLSEVIRNLESIRDNQYMVYQAVKEANLQTEKLYQSSMKILELDNANVENTALIEYNTRITAYNTSVMKNLAIYGN